MSDATRDASGCLSHLPAMHVCPMGRADNASIRARTDVQQVVYISTLLWGESRWLAGGRIFVPWIVGRLDGSELAKMTDLWSGEGRGGEGRGEVCVVRMKLEVVAGRRCMEGRGSRNLVPREV